MRRLTVVLLAGMAVLALAGAAWGASKINGKLIKTGTVTGKQVKNHSLTPKDFRGSVRGRRGRTGKAGSQGPQGAQGPQGTQGPAGSPGLSGLQTVESTPVSVAPGGSAAPEADCPTGKRVVGVGFTASITDVAFAQGYTYFAAGLFFNNTGVTATNISIQAICAFVAGASTASVGSRIATRDFARDVRLARTSHAALRAHAAKSCSSSSVRARIGGETKCLRAGEFCARRYQRKYRRQDFKCVRASDGRLRLKRR